MTKEDLSSYALKLEEEAYALIDDSYETYLKKTWLLQEAQNFREWSTYGCLLGRPDSTWEP